MEPAPELVAFVERWMPSWLADYNDFMDAFSRHAGTRFIGPDPNEWMEGPERLFAVAKAQFSEVATIGGVRIDTDEIVAWKEGTVGWIAVRGRLSIGQMDPQEARLTVIVHEEGAF